MATTANRSSIYGGKDPKEIPLYSMTDAAHYLWLPQSTLNSWVHGRSYPTADGSRRAERLIHRPDRSDPRLSFDNLVEAYVLKALRSAYEVKMSAIRAALRYAKQEFGIDRLFLSEQLCAAPGKLFLERYEELVDLQKPQQRIFREVFEGYTSRIDYESGWALKLYPIVQRDNFKGPKIVTIDPRISFGQPIVKAKGIRTAAIYERFQAGERPPEIAKDYDLTLEQIEEAIRYEGRHERAA